MPFTPFHMGPGILVKSLMHGSFSLMVFGWAQIVMDVQPLVVILRGEGHLHGFSHTYAGALILGCVAAVSGKYLSELGLYLLRLSSEWKGYLKWRVVFVSAYIGTLSHIVIDSIMHYDMEPYYPVSAANHMLGFTSVEMLHKLCLYSGVVGAVVFIATGKWSLRRRTDDS